MQIKYFCSLNSYSINETKKKTRDKLENFFKAFVIERINIMLKEYNTEKETSSVFFTIFFYPKPFFFIVKKKFFILFWLAAGLLTKQTKILFFC